MLILLALAMLQEPASVEVRLDDEAFTVQGVRLDTAKGMARLLKTGVHSVNILLVKVEDRWEAADADHTLWASETRGGRFVDLTVNVEETPTHLQGTIAGTLVEANGECAARVTFALPRRDAAPPRPPMNRPLALLYLVLMGLAGIAALAVRIWFCIRAARVSVLWLVVVLVAPCGDLFFVITHWDDAREPFFAGLGVAAVLLILVASQSFFLPT